jgi:hypothetical protein
MQRFLSVVIVVSVVGQAVSPASRLSAGFW